MSKRLKPGEKSVRQLFSERWQAVSALQTESDYAVVLIAVTFLEEMLGSLFRAKFVDTPKVVEALLGPDRPVSTFSARIKLAYCTGHISEGTYRDLEVIREIRNDFAHSRESLSFDCPAIEAKCRRLRYPLTPPGLEEPDCSTPRLHFLQQTFWIGNVLQAWARRGAPRAAHPKDRP